MQRADSEKIPDSRNTKNSKDNVGLTVLSDEELLIAARLASNDDRGQEAAVFTSELISRYIRIISIKANKYKSQKREKAFDTGDLISEGFLGLMSAVRAFEQGKGSFYAFANACINNRIKTALAQYKELPLAEDFDLSLLEDKTPEAVELIIERENKNELSVQLRGVLSEQEFKVLNLYINSFSYSQISEKLNITLKSVDNTLSRARAKLKKIL